MRGREKGNEGRMKEGRKGRRRGGREEAGESERGIMFMYFVPFSDASSHQRRSTTE